MRKLLSVFVAAVLLAAVAVPAASADRGWGGRGSWSPRHEYRRGGGCPGCAFIGGLILGGVLGGVLAAPYYAPPPPPVSAPPPPPTCYTRDGYWQQVPYQDGPFTDYRTIWVPPRTVCR